MPLLGSENKDKFDQMKEDINTRNSEWWYYRSGVKPISDDLQFMLDIIKEEFLVVGPLGPRFIKESRVNFKPSFYDIPLQYAFIEDNVGHFEAVAYVATNGYATVLTKSLYEYLRNDDNLKELVETRLTAICAQTVTRDGRTDVVSLECIENLRPLTYYEHPVNGRLLQAIENMDPPDHAAIVLCGNRRGVKTSLAEVYPEATAFYNEREMGNLTNSELSQRLFSYFSQS